MDTYPKIADNEMNYFQYKAHQMLMLKREECEWQDFCKQVAPECAACFAEETNSKESKDIGIQAFPRIPISKTERMSLPLKHQNDQIPEALNNIKTRLEKIDIALSKIYDVSNENEKERNAGEILPILYKRETSKCFEDQKRLLIQKSLKASLQKLHSSPSKVLKKTPPAIKLKNSSYFLPHDLQVKRAIARKAYLASLQNKPKISLQNVKQNKKNVRTSQNQKCVPKQTSKSKKKVIIKKVGAKESNVNKDETLISASKTDEAKDENIEHVVDGILDDLLGEAALDLNKIKHRKRERYSDTNKKIDIDKENGTTVPSVSLTSSPKKNAKRTIVASDNNNSIRKLKLFLDSYEEAQTKNEDLKDQKFIDKSTSTFPIEDSKYKLKKITAEKSYTNSQYKINLDIKPPPKFICGVSRIISIDSEKAKDISQNKDRYWRYLKNISRTIKGNFNPWILNEMLAESIVDDCINDIAEELSEMPSNFIQDLYNQEFVQQVE